jgi:hypothetical protein
MHDFSQGAGMALSRRNLLSIGLVAPALPALRLKSGKLAAAQSQTQEQPQLTAAADIGSGSLSADAVADAVRRGKELDVGDERTWSLYTSGSGGVAAGTDPVVGNYVRIFTNGAGNLYQAGRDLPVRLDDGKVISFMLRRNDAKLAVFDLYTGLGAYGTSPGAHWNKSVQGLDVGVWRRVVLHPQEREGLRGVPADFADLRSLTVRATAASGSSTSIDIADIRLHNPDPTGSVSFLFDDARLDTYTQAFPRLNGKGWTAGIAVEYNTVGGTGPSGPNGGARCTVANLSEMYASGWDMCGHHTAQMTTLSVAQQCAVHAGMKAFLSANGFRRGDRIWVWPGGARNQTTEAIARQYCWATMRRTDSFTTLGARHAYEPTDPAVVYVLSSVPVATLTSLVDRVAANGGSVTFVFHSLVSSNAIAEDWLLTNFQALLDYVDTSNVAVVPPSGIWTN